MHRLGTLRMRGEQMYFQVSGRVQGVMFRQTFIRGCQVRGLKAAASNLSDGTVSCYIQGPTDMINDLMVKLRSGQLINSWGACVDRITPLSDTEGIAFEKHQVTTSNVDAFNWSSGVDMYL